YLPGTAHRTWRVGQAIRDAVTPITAALCSAMRFLANPQPTRSGPEATTSALKKDIAQKLRDFRADQMIPLAAELAASVVADCAAQRGNVRPSAPPVAVGETEVRLPLSEAYILQLGGKVQRKILHAVNGKGNVPTKQVLKEVYGPNKNSMLNALL